jgi:hypothetical protein
MHAGVGGHQKRLKAMCRKNAEAPVLPGGAGRKSISGAGPPNHLTKNDYFYAGSLL